MSSRSFMSPVEPAGSADASAPPGLPVLDAGAHRDARSGSCVMEYVSVLAGERFTDRPACTHPAVAALAWQVNDAVSHTTRQELALRAPGLVGAGRGVGGAVRPEVLATIARIGLEIDPENRFFQRLRRRLSRAAARGVRADDRPGGRISTLLHVGPVNHACAHLLVAARGAGYDAAARDRLMVALLDDCLAALARPAATSGASTREPAQPALSPR